MAVIWDSIRLSFILFMTEYLSSLPSCSPKHTRNNWKPETIHLIERTYSLNLNKSITKFQTQDTVVVIWNIYLPWTDLKFE